MSENLVPDYQSAIRIAQFWQQQTQEHSKPSELKPHNLPRAVCVVTWFNAPAHKKDH